MDSYNLLVVLVLGLVLAPHPISATRELKQLRTRGSDLGSFGQSGPMGRPSGLSGQPGSNLQIPSSWSQQPGIPSTTTPPTGASNPAAGGINPSQWTNMFEPASPATAAPGLTSTVPTFTPSMPGSAFTTPSTTPITSTLGPSTTTTPATGSCSDPESSDPLTVHNQLRARHNAPALIWSDSLAQSAQSWSAGCQTQHSNGDYGENLAWGYDTWNSAIMGWYNEKSQYDYNNGGFSSATGHFTQVVWQGTTQLGCAVTQCGAGVGPFYVCQYSPPGNYEGQYQQNVAPSTCG